MWVKCRTCININRASLLEAFETRYIYMCLCIFFVWRIYSIHDDDADVIIQCLCMWCVKVQSISTGNSDGNNSYSSTYTAHTCVWTGDFPMKKQNTIQFNQRFKWCNANEHLSKRVFCTRMKYFIINWNEGVESVVAVAVVSTVRFVCWFRFVPFGLSIRLHFIFMDDGKPTMAVMAILW